MNIPTSRRELMKLLGVVPLAAHSTSAEVVSFFTKAGAATSGLQAILPASPSDRIENFFGKSVADHVRKMVDFIGDDEDARYCVRRNEIDPDIACLKSCSQAYKARKQYERIMEVRSIRRQFDSIRWG